MASLLADDDFDNGFGREELLGREIREHFSFGDRDDAVGVGGDEIHVVLDEDHGFHAGTLGGGD